jgi:RNA polymerase sigma factor (sigma-70 family)
LRRKIVRFPHYELEEVDHELPVVAPQMVAALDAARAVELLAQVGEPYQAALALFYMEDCSYKDIAEILGVPLGTVQSRISRGMAQLQQMVLNQGGEGKPAPARKEIRG